MWYDCQIYLLCCLGIELVHLPYSAAGHGGQGLWQYYVLIQLPTRLGVLIQLPARLDLGIARSPTVTEEGNHSSQANQVQSFKMPELAPNEISFK